MKLHKIGALAAVSMLAFAACSSGTAPAAARRVPPRRRTGGRQRAAGGGRRATRSAAACKNKKGTSSIEIHVYSSLPRQGTNTEQTNTLVEQIKTTLDGQKVGNFTIKYIDLDDSSAANNGDWDGAVEQANANKAVDRPGRDGLHRDLQLGRGQAVDPDPERGLPGHDQPGQQLPGPDQGRRGRHPPGEPDSYYPGGYRNYARVIATDDVQGARRRRMGQVARQQEGLRPRRHARSTAQGLGRVLGAPRRQDRRRGRQPEQDVRGLRRRRRPTTARSPRRSRRPAPTSSTSARSPARTPASCGRTSGRRCPTSRCHDRRRRLREVRGTTARARPATARSSPSAASAPVS